MAVNVRKISGETFVCPDVTAHFLAHSLFTVSALVAEIENAKKIWIHRRGAGAVAFHKANPFKYSWDVIHLFWRKLNGHVSLQRRPWVGGGHGHRRRAHLATKLSEAFFHEKH